MPFICRCQKTYKINDETFKFKLYFDSYKSTDCQRSKKCKNCIQLDQLKTIKRIKSRLKRNIKILQNTNDKIPFVQVKQTNAKS